MGIERSIYASLLNGIDQDGEGFQYYSYTPGFKQTAESDIDGVVKSASTSGYTKHSGNEWLTDIPFDGDITGIDRGAYPIRFPETVREANEAELKCKKTHPYMIAYKPIKIGGLEKSLFLFGKYMGVEWSGARPGNIYLYTTVCAPEDVKKAPILYCSSPAVCCDIPRSEFFPENGAPARPGQLKYLESLEDELDIAPTAYSAGFDEITIDEITEFITSDNNGDILNSMVTALMELKDGDVRRRLVIADEKRNVLLWIAALSYIFPFENMRGVSFSSYTYAPSDFDINGVFEPSLNNCFPDSVSGYDFTAACGKYAVYDFSRESYAPEVEIKKNLFTNMLGSAFEIDLSLLDNYKEYITDRTNYRGSSSDYAKGYDLFACLTGKTRFDLANAADFAKKYANAEDQKILLNKILDNYEKFAAEDCVNDYFEFCCKNGITTEEKIRAFFTDKFNAVFWDESIPDAEVNAAEALCRRMCKLSENDLSRLFVQMNGTPKLLELSRNTRSLYRLMYANRAALQYSNAQNITIGADTDAGRIVTETISRKITEDGSESIAKLENYLNENFKFIQNVLSRMGICDSILCALDAEGLDECIDMVIDTVSKLYLESPETEQKRILENLESFKFAESYAADILLNLGRESDLEKRVSGLRSFPKYAKKYAASSAGEIKRIALEAVKTGLGKSSPETVLNVCRSVLELLTELETELGADVDTSELESAYQGYLTALGNAYPDNAAPKERIDTLTEMKKLIKKHGGDGCEMIFDIFNSLSILNEEPKTPKSPCFTDGKISFTPVNIARLPDQLADKYIGTLGRICGEFWAKTDTFPNFTKLTVTPIDIKIEQKIFSAILKSGLQSFKNNARPAADAVEYSLVHNYTDVLAELDNWLDECGVKKSVVDQLAKDHKTKTELKKGYDQGLLAGIDPVKLEEQIERARKHYENSGGLADSIIGGFKSLFKRRE